MTATLPIRQFAAICLQTAKGQDVTSALRDALDLGVSKSTLARLARQHQVLALLSPALHRLGIGERFDVLNPKVFTARPMLMRAQLVELNEALVARGAKVTLIKGSIQLFRSLYGHIGARQMSDIDLLVADSTALTAFSDIGYVSAEGDGTIVKSLELGPGEHHLPQLVRAGSLAPIEAHIHPCSVDCAHLVGDVSRHATPASGYEALYLPDGADQLIIALIHAVKQDRNSMHGGLFIKSLVECEMLYEKLSEEERAIAATRLAENGGKGIWQAWRLFADWCFHQGACPPLSRLRAFVLVAEFELRSRGKAGVLFAATGNLIFDVLKPRFWKSGQYHYFSQKIFDRSFWGRLTEKIRASEKSSER
jgi:hypothetical protein